MNYPGLAALGRRNRVLLALQVLCAAGLAVLLGWLLRSPLSQLPAGFLGQATVFAVSYLVCAAILFWRERRSPSRPVAWLIIALAVAYTPSLLYLALTGIDLPRRALVVELACATVLAFSTVLLRGWPIARTLMLATAVAVFVYLPRTIPDSLAAPVVRTWRLNSALYPLRVTEFTGLAAPSQASGGALAVLRDRLLLATGDGEMYLLSQQKSGAGFDSRRLPYRVPINAAAFKAAVAAGVDTSVFRTADILAQDLGERVRVFVSHHYWNSAGRCFVVRVSMLETDMQSLAAGPAAAHPWRTVFESSPCLPVGTAGHFGGIQIGGRLALTGDHGLLVAVGDHEMDGVNAPQAASQDARGSYGKTHLIDLNDFSSHPFSSGHRNPQGLYSDRSGSIWLTEHGPQGGDELNLLERGANYGWPLATYGTQYGSHAWPMAAVAGSHDGFAEPYFSWVPSIGVSSLLVMHGTLFKLWNDDIVMASLKDSAVYRMRIRQARVVMTERIAIGRRIRDIEEGPDGELYLWTDRGAVLRLQIDTEAGSGEAVFTACAGCHVLGEGKDHGIGPDLRHIVGRKVASAPEARYSTALQELGGSWTRARLDRFLTDPQAFVPGTAMRFAGIPAAADRARLIEFLATEANNHPPPEN